MRRTPAFPTSSHLNLSESFLISCKFSPLASNLIQEEKCRLKDHGLTLNEEGFLRFYKKV